MNLYKVWIDIFGYDEYSSFVVAAETPEVALKATPDDPEYDAWPYDQEVHYELVGTAVPGFVSGDVILASYHAG